MQVKAFTPSAQEPPFSQGFEAHSSMLISHSEPSKPALQSQAKESTPSTHVPLLEHVCPAQASMFVAQSSPE